MIRESFLATIGFGMLAVAGAFVANLAVLIFTASQWHVGGVLLAIAAAGAAYWGQAKFTMAAIYRQDATEATLVAYTAAADKAEMWGTGMQLLALLLVVFSLVCFWLGMQ
jgi:hypothetical protein